ncbi:MAG TPA: alkyl sulfatase dimerization domain-containing protein [Nitriliruptorales bacterium]
MSVLDLADQLWRGETTVEEHHPLQRFTGIEEVADGVGFMSVMSNVILIDAGDELALVDTGTQLTADHVFQQVRGVSSAPLRAAVFSHGHIDHVFGVGPFDEEASSADRARPEVFGHEAMPARFERYRLTAGYNGVINRRQFGIESLDWPTEYRHPDTTYRDGATVEVGDLVLELHHDRGETDDHTWTWIADRKVLCPGDLFIWASPNCGNPQKVQRYPREWAAGLRKMAALDADLLLPGHGVPIAGADRVRQALTDTASYLESLVEQTLALMNEGRRLEDILHEVEPPAELADRPYLRPVYDEPEFIVRNLWRLYGGWYDGNPAHLKPAPAAALAAELAGLAGGAGALAARATQLSDAGDHRLAAHLAEHARLAAPDDAEVVAAHGRVFAAFRDAATSTMAKGVYGAAARDSGTG